MGRLCRYDEHGEHAASTLGSTSVEGCAFGLRLRDLRQGLAEVVPLESAEYQECRSYVWELGERIGETRAQAFLQEFGAALPLVQQANATTKEVKPADKLRASRSMLSRTSSRTTGVGPR